MPHHSGRHRDQGTHHHGHKSGKQLKASSMATRNNKASSDSKKLLTKTYSEIGVSGPNHASETPTPSEKVSKWHRDILLVSPPHNPQQQQSSNPHPRQCICDQCMAEYGTYRIYNQLLDINPNASIIKISEDEQRQPLEGDDKQIIRNDQNASKHDKVRLIFSF